VGWEKKKKERKEITNNIAKTLKKGEKKEGNSLPSKRTAQRQEQKGGTEEKIGPYHVSDIGIKGRKKREGKKRTTLLIPSRPAGQGSKKRGEEAGFSYYSLPSKKEGGGGTLTSSRRTMREKKREGRVRKLRAAEGGKEGEKGATSISIHLRK